jgi:hypothetical protein
MSVAEFDRRAERLFSLCRDSISTGFSEYGPDGGWAEGPGYWHYATQYAICLLDSLSTALGTDLGLDASPGLSRTGYFRLYAAGPSGKLFNFADGEEDHSGGYWLFWLAKRYRHPVDAGIELRGRKIHPMDLLWFDAHGREPSQLPTAQRFHAADVVMLRGSWDDPNTTYLGIKGGANDACKHGHYDLGSFVLDANGVRWAIDLGPDNYELRGYFEPEMRARYYRTSTIGHNTIVINGDSQPLTARAVITHEGFADEISFVVMDLSTAYPGTVSALRGFALIDRRHVLISMKSCRTNACRLSIGRCTLWQNWASPMIWRRSSIRRKATARSLPGFISGSLIQVSERYRACWRLLPRCRQSRTPTPASSNSCSTSSKSRDRCALRSCCHLMRIYARPLNCPLRSGALWPTGCNLRCAFRSGRSARSGRAPAPSPSTTVAPRISRSYIPALLLR